MIIKPGYGYYSTAQVRIITNSKILAWTQDLWLKLNGYEKEKEFTERDRTPY